jgi:hypothetical protein
LVERAFLKELRALWDLLASSAWEGSWPEEPVFAVLRGLEF